MAAEEDKMTEIRDRIIMVERDHHNLEKNFTNFKNDTTSEFRQLNSKIDTLSDKIDKINQTLAKWLGGGAVALAILQLIIQQIGKHQ